MQASGTSRFGFSTAAEFCAADSMPRNAHSVSEMLEPMPSRQADALAGSRPPRTSSPLNQNQPANEMKPDRQDDAPDRDRADLPVRLGPPKLATVVSHSSAMTPMQVATGVEVSHGKNAAR